MTRIPIKGSLSLILALFLITATFSLPGVHAQEEVDVTEMMEYMMGMFMSLDVEISAATNKLQDENATIYITVSTSGAPVFVSNMSVWMMYDSGDDWEEMGPPVPWGYWEIQNGEDIDHSLGKIWHGGYRDPDTDDWIEIPGLYAITWSHGWLPGDYLITAYAEANMSEMMEFAQIDQTMLGNIFGNMTMRGYGSFCITVSETLTIAAYTTLGIAEGLEALGESMSGFQSSFENMTLYLENMTVFQEEMEAMMIQFQSSFEEMQAFQTEMGGIFENMTIFQDELVESMQSFVEVLEASRVEIEVLRGKIATVGTDIGEMIVALPLLYEEAQHIQEVTTAGVPIAYVLSAIAALASIISVVFLVTLQKKFEQGVR
jgi:hypothetical protein